MVLAMGRVGCARRTLMCCELLYNPWFKPWVIRDVCELRLHTPWTLPQAMQDVHDGL